MIRPQPCQNEFQEEASFLCDCCGGNLAQLTRLPAIRINGRERRLIHFHRFRAKRGLTRPDTRGSFWRIEFAEAPNAPSLARGPRLDPFAEPIQGPLAFGFACHFGLGMFRRADI